MKIENIEQSKTYKLAYAMINITAKLAGSPKIEAARLAHEAALKFALSKAKKKKSVKIGS